jgi:hypothetical protein
MGLKEKKFFQQIDWKLFLFLILFLNVKIWVKCLAMILLYALRFNFRFAFRRKHSRLPLFYPAMILIALINALIYGPHLSAHYGYVMVTGVLFWLFCILAIHQLKLSVDHSPAKVIHRTLELFFLLNIVCSFFHLLAIIVETGAVNPYRYQGIFQKYFIGTGDYIKGLSFDSSTTNALINAMGVIYFLNRRKTLFSLGCMISVLMTGSNLTNILLISALIFSFVFQSDRRQKSLIAMCLMLLVVFMAGISPQNSHYITKSVKDALHMPDDGSGDSEGNLKTPDSEDLLKIRKATAYLDSVKKTWVPDTPVVGAVRDPWSRPETPQPDINAPEYQSVMDTTSMQKKLMAFAQAHYRDSVWFIQNTRTHKMPGKLVATIETIQFFAAYPWRMITGNGMGNFSSKLAFRVSALNIAGGYPASHAYINPDFMQRHLRLYLYFFTQHKDVHSIIHTPDSVFHQLAGEYGITGMFCFLVFYLGWFTVRIKKSSYSVPLLILMIGAFSTGYWFEQLSIVVLFELLMLLDNKINTHPITAKKNMI